MYGSLKSSNMTGHVEAGQVWVYMVWFLEGIGNGSLMAALVFGQKLIERKICNS